MCKALKNIRNRAMWKFREECPKTDGSASAKALRQKCACPFGVIVRQSVWLKQSEEEGEKEGARWCGILCTTVRTLSFTLSEMEPRGVL